MAGHVETGGVRHRIPLIAYWFAVDNGRLPVIDPWILVMRECRGCSLGGFPLMGYRISVIVDHFFVIDHHDPVIEACNGTHRSMKKLRT